MPRKGGKKKQASQGGQKPVAPDEVQLTQSNSGTVVPQARPTISSRDGIQDSGASGWSGEPSGLDQRRGPQELQKEGQSLQGHVNVASVGRGSGRGAGRGLGLSYGRDPIPRPGGNHQQSLLQEQGSGAPLGRVESRGRALGLSYERSSRPGGYHQQSPQVGSTKDESSRPDPIQQQQSSQVIYESQMPACTSKPEQFQQLQWPVLPGFSQPMTPTSQVIQRREIIQVQQQHPSVQKQPLSRATSALQPSPKLEYSSQQVPDVQNVTKALSEVSLQQSTSSQGSINNQGNASAVTLSIPKRKDFYTGGTLGRRIFVLTNMMEIVFGPNFQPNVVHYDVSIEPDKSKYLTKSAFDAAKNQLFPNKNPAFDGKKNVFSAGLLPFGETATVEVIIHTENGREMQIKVTFKKAADGDLDLSWLKNVGPGVRITDNSQKCLQALDIIFRMAPALKSIPVGRSFFTSQAAVKPLGGGMDCWVGHFQSAILGWKPLLNIDVAHKAFPTPQPVMSLIETIIREKQKEERWNQNQGPITLTFKLIEKYKQEINRYLRGLKVAYQIPDRATTKRTSRFNELVQSPRLNRFEYNGDKISVEEYFKLKYKYDIKYPEFHCLWVGDRNRQNYIPIELCTIVGEQVTQKKLDDKQTSAMISYAASDTDKRKQKIMEEFNKVRFNDDPCMEEFGISVSGKFEEIPARILNPPALTYKNGDVAVSRGQWNAKQFLEPSPLISGDYSWTILNLNHRTQQGELYNFAEQLKRTAEELGIKLGMFSHPFVKLDTRSNLMQNLQDYLDFQKKNNIKLVIVVVPEMKGPYAWVKQTSELKIGIVTQCLKGTTLSRIQKDRSGATIQNILLKINAKLNGINHKISPKQPDGRPSCLEEPCMIVGADVTHPPPDAKDIPSIAAVVASHDPYALFKYNPEIRLQPAKEEIIIDLAEIMKIQLEFFHQKSGHWPRRIIFYRDGVGEGHFPKVLQREVMAIRAACTAVERQVGYKYEPKITFLVVQKRHHTRFFPTNPSDSDDARPKRNGEPGNYNVKAGTIVDTHITHPTDIEFYLVSHASIQGTARPTKYRVLWDDADMSLNDIQQLTYYLCHVFARCTRSVSYPTPTYYAHYAASRARVLTHDVPINLEDLAQEQRFKLALKEDLRKNFPMFFV